MQAIASFFIDPFRAMSTPKRTSTLTAHELMVTDVQTAHPDWPVEQLATFFKQHVITGAPVVDDDGFLVGVVSITDIAEYTAEATGQGVGRFGFSRSYHASADDAYAEEDLVTLRIQEEPDATVRDVMTTGVHRVDVGATVQRVADTMLKHRIHRVLVTEDGELKGLITAFDLMRLVRDM